MKRVLAGIAVAAGLLLATSFLQTSGARADNGPHVSGNTITTDACAGCHRAHTARGAYLLKVNELQLCYTCHDGTQASTNVSGGVTTAAGGATAGQALRAGGFAQAMITTTDPTYSYYVGNMLVPACAPGDTMGPDGKHCYGGGAPGSTTVTIQASQTAANTTSHHSVDGSLQSVWGNGAIGSGAGAQLGLECTSCHDPHGNGQFRILRTTPAHDSSQTLNDTFSTGVAIPDIGTMGPANIASKLYFTNNYFDTSEFTGSQTASSQTAYGISAWCSQCHTRYLTNPGSYKVDSGDAIFAFRHATTSYAPSCVKCHAAHGTNAAATGWTTTVAWPGSGDTNNQQASGGGGSRLLKMDNRGVCQKCHKR